MSEIISAGINVAIERVNGTEKNVQKRMNIQKMFIQKGEIYVAKVQKLKELDIFVQVPVA